MFIMKKIFFTVAFLVSLCLQQAFAQFVEIPDTAFKRVLLKRYPACFNASKQMDTTCTTITTVKSLFLMRENIADIEGIQYFDALEILTCSTGILTTVRKLPETLKHFDCSVNQLTSLPEMPSQLLSLDCSSNKMTVLPNLPLGLTSLYCQYNSLTTLPVLPQGLEYLSCSANSNISCLPLLPSSLRMLDMELTKIVCIPNRPVNLYRGSDYALCNTSNNTYRCPISSSVYGRAFVDENKDGIYNAGEVYLANTKIRVTGQNTTYSITSAQGAYSLATDKLGNFSFQPEALPQFSWSPSTKTVSFSTSGEQIVQDFALQAIVPFEDAQTVLVPLNIGRPGFPLAFEIDNANLGSLNTTIGTTFNFPPDYLVDSIKGGGKVSSPGVVTWAANELAPFHHTKYKVYGRLSPNTVLGSLVAFSSTVTPANASEENKANNTNTSELKVRGSFDPNDKAAAPFISPNQVAAQDPILYTIRCQNTGTDTAFTVVIMDTLPSQLQANTLEMLASSHDCQVTVKGSVVKFEFQKINLLWKSFNEPLSHGYVHFKVKAKPTLVLGDQIANTASIYFDFNKPIVTNTVVTTVGFPIVTELSEVTLPAQPMRYAYPNPATMQVHLFENGQVEVYAADGKIALHALVIDHTLDVSSLSKGLYQLKLVSPTGSHWIKLAKE